MTLISVFVSKQQRQDFKFINLWLCSKMIASSFLQLHVALLWPPFLLLYWDPHLLCISFQFYSHYPPSKFSTVCRYQSLSISLQREELWWTLSPIFPSLWQDWWVLFMNCVFLKTVLNANLWFPASAESLEPDHHLYPWNLNPGCPFIIGNFQNSW